MIALKTAVIAVKLLAFCKLVLLYYVYFTLTLLSKCNVAFITGIRTTTMMFTYVRVEEEL